MTEEERKSLLEWEFILKNICDFVQVGRVNGIRFEVYSNEQGHNRTHLHVSTADANMSIAIDNGDILACSGKISPAQKKMAQKWIEKNHELIVAKWNEFSNGFEIEVA